MQNRALAGFRRHEDDRDEILKADSKNVYDQEKGVIEMVGAHVSVATNFGSSLAGGEVLLIIQCSNYS